MAHEARPQPAEAFVVVRTDRPAPVWRWTPRRLEAGLLLACLLLPLALFGFKVWNDREMMIAAAYRDMESEANAAEYQAQNSFETYQLVGTLLNEHIKGLTWAEIQESTDVTAYLKRLVVEYPHIAGIALQDAQGRVRQTTTEGPITDLRYNDRDYFMPLADQDVGTVVGQRIRSKLGLGDLLTVTRRRGSGSVFDGVIQVRTRPEYFTGFWERTMPGRVTGLFRLDGRLLARYPEPGGDILEVRASAELLVAANAADRGTITVNSGIDGVERIASFRRLAGFPVYVVHAVDMAQVIAVWRANALQESVFFAIGTAGLLGLALLVIRQSRQREAANALLQIRSLDLEVEAERRRQAERELTAVLRDMVGRQETERKRIARDLHDSLGQHMAVMHLGLDSVLRRIEPAQRPEVDALKATATEVSHEISRLAWELRPVGLDELGLETAVRSFLAAMSLRTEVKLGFYLGSKVPRLDRDAEATLYRVTQEAITNVLKHAQATRADVMLEIRGSRLTLIIEDDGVGFMPDESLHGGPGGRLGLLGMRERLALVGGSLEIESAPGKGTTLIIIVSV